MGTPPSAVYSLKALYEFGLEIPLVITQPDRPKGRGNQIQPTPVKEYAESVGLNVVQPEKIKNNQEIYDLIKSYAPDFYAVAAYGKILPGDILSIPKVAPVNVHFSLLPKYRGAAPVNWSIYYGDEFTGVTTMIMDVGMDTGDMLLTEKVMIGEKNAHELSQELSIAGAELLLKTLINYKCITPVKQPDELATYAPMLKKEDGLIDWNKSAPEIKRMVKAFYPWPSAYSFLNGKTVKFFDVEISGFENNASPGTVVSVSKEDFIISAGAGSIVVNELQLEGKKRMSARDFLLGTKLNIGDCFG